MELTAEQRRHETRRITLWGVVVNIVLAIIKTVGGVLGHSAALLADGIHSISDLLSDGLVLFASKHAAEDADEDHPYGHARFETLATVALGGLLVLVAIGIAWDSLLRLIDDTPIDAPHVYTLYIAALSIISKEVLYHLTRQVGQRIRSKMLEANAWHHRTDAVSSVIVLIGIGGALLGYPMLDAYAALIVALMVAKIGIELGYHSIMELVDTALEPELVDRIRNEILSVEDVQHLHMLRSRRMGHNALIDVHIQVSPRLSVSEGHHISENVETLLKDRFEEISDVTVHIDPEDDETAANCIDLPMRSALLSQLEQSWSSEQGLSAVEDIVLHYLDGEIHVQASLKLGGISDIASARDLQARFTSACLNVDGVEHAELRFI